MIVSGFTSDVRDISHGCCCGALLDAIFPIIVVKQNSPAVRNGHSLSL